MKINDFWASEERPLKAEVRNHAIKGLSFLKTSLWMPGPNGYCVNSARENGLLDETSKIILVERNEAHWNDIEKNVIDKHKWNFKPFLWKGELADLKIPFELDFAFIDLNGGITKQIFEFFNKILNYCLKPSSVLCLTHSEGWRNNYFLYQFECENIEELRKERINNEINNDTINMPILLIKKSLDKWDFEIRKPVRYKDSNRKMVLYKFNNFVHRNQIEMENEVTKTQKAAHHAWITRNLNKKIENCENPRSIAAFKANATRKLRKLLAEAELSK